MTTSASSVLDINTSRQLFADLQASWEAAKATLVDASLRKIHLHAHYAYSQCTLEVGQQVVCRCQNRQLLGTVVGLRNPVFGLSFGEVLLYCPEQNPLPFSVSLEDLVWN